MPKRLRQAAKRVRQTFREIRGSIGLARGKKKGIEATLGRETGKKMKSRMRYGTSNVFDNIGNRFLSSFPTKRLRGKKGQEFVVRKTTSSFEAEYAITLASQPIKEGSATGGGMLGQAKIGFVKGAVIIEALQGRIAKQGLLDRFRQMHGMPWANFLLKSVEDHARKMGYKKVKIRVPESLYYYKNPMLYIFANRKERRAEKNETRARMRALYEKASKAMGYKRKGNFFVKEL